MLTYNREEATRCRDLQNRYPSLKMIYKHYIAPRKSIGACSYLYKIHKPSSDVEFFEKYLDYGWKKRDVIPVEERGLSEEELIEKANEFMERGNKVISTPLDFETYLNALICHIITETFDGKIREEQIMEYMRNLGYECTFCTDDLDALYNIDIKVSKNGVDKFAVQVKPLSFFMGATKDCVADKKKACVAYEAVLKDFGLKTYYAIYDSKKQRWLYNKEGKIAFNLRDLFKYDPENLEKTWTDCNKTIKKIIKENEMAKKTVG